MHQQMSYTRVFLKAAGYEIDSEAELKKYQGVWWWNNRSKDEGGLRLTEQGFEFITDTAGIKTYKVDFPSEFSVTPQVLIWLDRFIDSPYYITKKDITVMKERAAFELYLFSGDVRKLGHNKALSKRLSQESTEE
jgi:hypothetical protein